EFISTSINTIDFIYALLNYREQIGIWIQKVTTPNWIAVFIMMQPIVQKQYHLRNPTSVPILLIIARYSSARSTRRSFLAEAYRKRLKLEPRKANRMDIEKVFTNRESPLTPAASKSSEHAQNVETIRAISPDKDSKNQKNHQNLGEEHISKQPTPLYTSEAVVTENEPETAAAPPAGSVHIVA
ncbi:MAG: hypothetical protein KDD53_12615, partial [Bdellovibrionales bacterium]|nr:hypothetical protein [Bdellovibrionales bacterium]